MLIVFYILAGAWSAGCIAGVIHFFVTTFDEDGFFTWIIELVVGAPLAILIAAIPWFALTEATSPILATLKKGEWVCRSSHSDSTLVPMVTGNTTILMPISERKCDEYVRL